MNVEQWQEFDDGQKKIKSKLRKTEKAKAKLKTLKSRERKTEEIEEK